MASQGSHGYRGISSNFEFAREQLLHAFFALENHDQVYSFYPDLRSPASAPKLDECRRTPAPRRAASGDTLAVFRSENESSFDQVGYNRYALGPLHNVVGNTLVRRVHDLVHHGGCVIEPVDGILAF